MSWSARGLSLLLLNAFVTAVLVVIALLHRAGPSDDGVRVHWLVQSQGESTRYQSHFKLPASTATQALYIESLSGAATIYLNGTVLAQRHIPAVVPALGGSQPMLVPLPSALLHTTGNELAIEQAGAPSTSTFIGASYLGDEALLAPHYAQRHFLKHTLLIALIIATLVLAGVSFALWLRRRHEKIYAWHALTCVAGSAYCALPISPLPLPSIWLDALLLLFFLWFVVGAAWLGICLASKPQPKTWQRTTYAVFSSSALIVIASLFCTPQDFRDAVPWAYMGIIAIGTYTTATVFWRQYFTRWDNTAFWMLGAVMCICMVSLHDGALLLGLIAPDDGFWLAYGAPPPVVVFTALLLRNFVNALTESESLSRELEQRVAAREAQIASNYQALQRAESDRVVSAERERLFGDLHDGLGGTLIATLSRLSNEGAGDSAVALGVQTALEDLRLTLDSLNPEERSLRAVLAPLRERLANVCADAEIALVFSLNSLDDDFELPKSQTLHLLRIVQEAAMNAVRHAQGSSLRITLHRIANDEGVKQLEVLIDDNGRGMPTSADARPGHYGLANLHRRAMQIGGGIEWLSLQPGTRVRLTLPLV
ncbi:MAG: ATP-binding protein [Pseudomonadota bacterium]